MVKLIQIGQFVISALLVAAILLQQRGTGSSAIMGGSSASYYTKRGFDKILFYATICLAILFMVLAILALILRPSA